MSKYYNAQRKRNLYDPASSKPFKLSRSKISDYRKCTRCFYLDRRLGTGQPPGYPFTLNLAVDALLKTELQTYREQGIPHPATIDSLGLNVIPSDKLLPEWKENFKGVQFLHKETNFIITGALDELLHNKNTKKEHITDFKGTARKEPVTEINPDYGYKEQAEIYQWLLRNNGLDMSDTAYFWYLNGDKSLPGMYLREEIKKKPTIEELEKILEQGNSSIKILPNGEIRAVEPEQRAQLFFETTIIPLECDDSWVEPTLIKIHKCLNSDKIPPPSDDCDYCAYRKAIENHVKKN